MEFSPFGQSEDIVEFCRDNGIIMIADESRLHRMRHTHSEVSFIADELNITVDEVIS